MAIKVVADSYPYLPCECVCETKEEAIRTLRVYRTSVWSGEISVNDVLIKRINGTDKIYTTEENDEFYTDCEAHLMHEIDIATGSSILDFDSWLKTQGLKVEE